MLQADRDEYEATIHQLRQDLAAFKGELGALAGTIAEDDLQESSRDGQASWGHQGHP